MHPPDRLGPALSGTHTCMPRAPPPWAFPFPQLWRNFHTGSGSQNWERRSSWEGFPPCPIRMYANLSLHKLSTKSRADCVSVLVFLSMGGTSRRPTLSSVPGLFPYSWLWHSRGEEQNHLPFLYLASGGNSPVLKVCQGKA